MISLKILFPACSWYCWRCNEAQRRTITPEHSVTVLRHCLLIEKIVLLPITKSFVLTAWAFSKELTWLSFFNKADAYNGVSCAPETILYKMITKILCIWRKKIGIWSSLDHLNIQQHKLELRERFLKWFQHLWQN